MARSVWKGPFVDFNLLKKVSEVRDSGSHPSKNLIKTWARRCTIIPDFVGITFSVHNGKKFIPVTVTEEMIGYKLGAFAPTRTFTGHAGDKKVKKK